MTGARHLVVAYNFPPFADASAVTQAKRIATDGHQVDVVSQDLTGLRRRDDTLLRLVSPFVDHHDIISGRPQFLAWPSLRQFATRGMRRVSIRGPLTRYGTVRSRSMWPHSHVLAALVKVAHPEVEWLAEFSDPLLRRVDGSHRPSPPLPEEDALLHRLLLTLPAPYRRFMHAGGQMLHLIQALSFGLADRLVFTNDQQRTVMLEDLGNETMASAALDRSEISPHPTPPSPWVPAPAAGPGVDEGLCRIGYFGTLYANRGLGAIVEALRLLPPSLRAQLRIDVHTEQRTRTYEQVRRCRVADVIRVRPALPYTDFLRAASTYDHLLVTDTQTGGFSVANPFLPSKVSDYAATSANILSLVAPGSELDRRGYWPTARADDVTSIRNALAQAVSSTALSRSAAST